jgi:putative ABC transport system permease protein
VTSTLTMSSWRYLLKHPWQIGLSIVGIAIGVAVVVSIDIANQSAANAFQLSMQTVTGDATHQIVGGSAGVSEEFYKQLRLQYGIRRCAPVIESYVISDTRPPRTLKLLGLDAFAEKPFRSYFGGVDQPSEKALAKFLSQPNSAFISQYTAVQLKIGEGDTLRIKVNDVRRNVVILGYITSENDQSAHALDDVLLTDIACAQELTGMVGYLSRIDLIFADDPQDDSTYTRIKSILPPGYRLMPSQTRSRVADQMVHAFQVNLMAMSLLALIVGMFLIFNTMTFSVVQRRNHIGLLRCIGVTRKEIFAFILNEALVLGLIGTILGISGGIVLGRAMILLVTRTINDLYFVVSVREMHLTPFMMIKGFVLGIGASVLAAVKPALEATEAPPRHVLSRSLFEAKIIQDIPRLAGVSFVLMILGIVILALSGKSVFIGFAGILPIIIAFAMLTPLSILIVSAISGPFGRRIFGILGSLTTRGIISQLRRTTVAVAALSVAVAASVGVGTMVNSFRKTVIDWLRDRLVADIYISAPNVVARKNDATMAPGVEKRISTLNGVAGLNYFREIIIDTPDDEIHVIGSYVDEPHFKTLKFKSGNPEDVWRAFKYHEGLVVSESFAYHHNLSVGDRFSLPTDVGAKSFRVDGIYYDYISDVGNVSLAYEFFQKYWQDRRLSGILVYALKGVVIEELMRSIQSQIQPDEDVYVRSSRYWLSTSVDIFNRTFLVTQVLQVLAIIVAFIGILSALMALQLEKARELAILRANGLTPRQLWLMLGLQTGFMGLVAGLISLPLGNVLAGILIYIINKRSFGWSLQFSFRPEMQVEAIVLALVAAVIAGLYPAYKMSKTSPALALREE